MRKGFKRFGVAGILAVLSVATSGCGEGGPDEGAPKTGQALNLTAQTGVQQFARASFAVQKHKDGSGVLTIKDRRNHVLELGGGDQFSIMPVQMDPTSGDQLFIATTSLVEGQMRHIGWVARAGSDGWEAFKLPFSSAQPIRAPIDINDDGRLEFVVADTNFDPVMFEQDVIGGPEAYFIVKDEGVIDHTAHSQYAVHRDRKRELARAACDEQKTTAACSVYAAWSAQGRKLNEAWPLVMELADQPAVSVCRTPQGAQICTDTGTGVVLSVPEYIQFRLGQGGYIAPAFINFPDDDDASFGCAHARTVAERTICSEPALRALERREAAQASRDLAFAKNRSNTVDERMSFIARRDRTMGVLALTELYQQRLTR